MWIFADQVPSLSQQSQRSAGDSPFSQAEDLLSLSGAGAGAGAATTGASTSASVGAGGAQGDRRRSRAAYKEEVDKTIALITASTKKRASSR